MLEGKSKNVYPGLEDSEYEWRSELAGLLSNAVSPMTEPRVQVDIRCKGMRRWKCESLKQLEPAVKSAIERFSD
jgi:hypothetical protein